MKPNRDTDSLRGAATINLDPDVERASCFASEVKKQWRNGATPDAAAILAEHPQLLRYRSLVLDLAAEEYMCRQAFGEAMTADEFAVRFPGMEKSLFFLLEVRRMLRQESAFGLSCDEVNWPEPGDEFLGFSLLAELGKGTFGRVFLASEPSLGNRLVALKVAPQGQWEAEILGKLGHPNIVPVYSIQKDPQTNLTAVCMPYLGRVTLLDVIERVFPEGWHRRRKGLFAVLLRELNDGDPSVLRKDFDSFLSRSTYLDTVVHLGIQMADALAFTHEQGIYHRDLKPSNILLSDTGHPLILDFNLSSDERISPARMGGTLPYMAPEQLQCLLTDCAPARPSNPALSDLFSLGVILYELASGALPFGLPNMKGNWNDVALDLLARQKKGPRPLREVNSVVDGRLARLIERCLAFDPQNRYRSVKALADSLRGQQSLYCRMHRWARHHSYLLAGIGVCFLICGLSCGLWLASRDPYPIRLYKVGLSNLQGGNANGAIESFNAALKAAPHNRQFLLARGKAYYLQGKYSLASEDYQQAYAIEPTAELAALQGHCYCRMKHYREAIECYEQALNADYRSISLLNNLGFCHMQLAKLPEAESFFQQAIFLDPHCSIAWHNAVRLAINRYNRNEMTLSASKSMIKKALAEVEASADFYLDVAILESLLAKQDSGLISNVFEHLNKAIALGVDPKRIARRLEFEHLRDREEYSALMKLSPGIPASPNSDGIMSPF